MTSPRRECFNRGGPLFGAAHLNLSFIYQSVKLGLRVKRLSQSQPVTRVATLHALDGIRLGRICDQAEFNHLLQLAPAIEELIPSVNLVMSPVDRNLRSI